MPVLIRDGQQLWFKRTRQETLAHYLKWLAGAVVFLIAARYISEHTTWMFVWDAPRQAADFVSRMFPPDFRYALRIQGALWDTINIAIFGTAIATAISIVIAVLAASNTTPHPAVRALALVIVVGSRSVNSLIWAILIVQVVGPGLFAGVLAIAVRSIGMISKLLYEAIEEIDRKPIEAVTATGANWAQIFAYGYVPQLLPIFVGVVVYRWEINIRESTIIGIVGGGGIGFLLNSAINRLAWDQVIVVLFTIILLVIVTEWVSARARSAIT